MAGLSCGDGEILLYSTTSQTWGCGTDTDTTLTESEVRTMMEGASALSLDLREHQRLMVLIFDIKYYTKCRVGKY